MSRADAILVTQLLPIAVDLVTKLVNAAKTAKDAGAKVPSTDKLKELKTKLEELEDL